MRVLKFGGSSVGNPDTFTNAIRLVRAERDEVVVVVSALIGVTNLLVEFLEIPERREGLGEHIVERHRAFAKSVGVDAKTLDPLIAIWRGHVDDIGSRRNVEPDMRDATLSFGERFSAELFAAGLRLAGMPAQAVLAGDAGLVTDEKFGKAHPVADVLSRMNAAFRPLVKGAGGVPVVTGFLGRTEDGRITTLGRGGSDYSAALIGAALPADEIQIWTDTNGLLSADPTVVPDARPVPELSFAEASELAYFGARVLHPKTLLPAMAHGVPVRVLNTSHPDDPGSLVTPDASTNESSWGVKSIATKGGITAVTIVSTRMLLAHGFLARVFEVFGRHQIAVDLVTTSEVSISVTVDDDSKLDTALRELRSIGNVDVRGDLAVVAVVGEGAPRRVGLAGRVFDLLGREDVVIEMISQGASRVNLSFVVREEDARRCVRLLHEGLGLGVAAVASPADA